MTSSWSFPVIFLLGIGGITIPGYLEKSISLSSTNSENLRRISIGPRESLPKIWY
jgi:hypothetical protein